MPGSLGLELTPSAVDRELLESRSWPHSHPGLELFKGSQRVGKGVVSKNSRGRAKQDYISSE